MAYYTTKSSVLEKDYVVIKHGIPNVNSMVMGVRFRDSWAVVEKDSKVYFRLKQLPMLKGSEERPLSFLKQLPFITRALDVKLIYGADVYAKYVSLEQKNKQKKEIEQKLLEEKLHLEDETKCKFRLDNGSLCKHDVEDPSISAYCRKHLLKDPRLEDTDIRIPVAMTREDRKKLTKTAFNKLKNLVKSEDNVNVSMVENYVSEEEVSEREET